MTTYTYNYEIKDVDQINKTMIVEYTPSLAELTPVILNIPIPTINVNVDVWVNIYAPKTQWQYQQNEFPNINSLVGQSGTLTTISPAPVNFAELNSVSGDQSTVEGFNAIPANTVVL
jgi:hypothetical protein